MIMIFLGLSQSNKNLPMASEFRPLLHIDWSCRWTPRLGLWLVKNPTRVYFLRLRSGSSNRSGCSRSFPIRIIFFLKKISGYILEDLILSIKLTILRVKFHRFEVGLAVAIVVELIIKNLNWVPLRISSPASYFCELFLSLSKFKNIIYF